MERGKTERDPIANFHLSKGQLDLYLHLAIINVLWYLVIILMFCTHTQWAILIFTRKANIHSINEHELVK